MSAATTYAPDRIGYRYGTPDSAYSKGYHRGQDVRLRGPYGSLVTQVDAIDDGVVVYVGRPNGLLAWTVVIDTGRARGRYESHSHMADISVGVGQRVSSGDRLGRNASMDEDHGFIDGVHDHVTITDRFDGAWVTWLNEYDPLPFMQAAYARATQGDAATGGSTPFDPEEDDMYTDEDRARAERIERKLDRQARIMGGTDGGPTLFDYLRPVKAGIERLATIVGGSIKGGVVVGGNVINRLRDIRDRAK